MAMIYKELKVFSFTFLAVILFGGCGKEDFDYIKVPVIESKVFTGIEYPELKVEMSNGDSYVYNEGGDIAQLGPIINGNIDFNKQQSDTVTLLVHRHDVPYMCRNRVVGVWKDAEGRLIVHVTYELDRDGYDYEDRYVNVICIKIPKIKNLTTFSYGAAVKGGY